MNARRDFWLLWGGTAASNLGDGIRLTALPLLAATITTDPAAIGAVFAVSFLPWLLLSLVGGAAADRTDRRRLILWGQGLRGVAVAAFAALVATGNQEMAAVYVIALVIGAGEVVVDSALQAAIPRVVPAEDLDRANSRFLTARLTAEIIGGPVGGALFAVAAFLPFLVDALSFGIGALLVVLITRPLQEATTEARPDTSILADIAEGARFLRNQPVLRGLAIAGALANLADAAIRGLMVLLVVELLDAAEVTFGLIIMVGALGGIAGSMAAPRIVAWLDRRAAVLIALATVAAGNATVGLAPNPAVVGIGAFGVMFAVCLWNVSSHSIRQRLTPDHLLGRVIATFRFVVLGAAPIGGLLGGVVARYIGIRETMVGAAGVSLLALSAATVATVGRDFEPEPQATT